MVPVAGLAECGLEGWFDPVPWDSRIALDLKENETFAVIAHGKSMQPEGIRPGFVCYCRPGSKPRKNDIIYARRKDGRATIKKFLETENNEWLRLRGYLDPNQGGQQEPYEDKVRLKDIEEIAVIELIQRRL